MCLLDRLAFAALLVVATTTARAADEPHFGQAINPQDLAAWDISIGPDGAGLPPGRYAQWGKELEVLPGGKVVVPGTPFLAGSGVLTDACVAVLLQHPEVTLSDGIDMASARPRQLLGLPPADLEPGMAADLLLFEYGPQTPFALTAALVGGRRVTANLDGGEGV